MNLFKVEPSYSWIDVKNYILNFIANDEKLTENLSGTVVLPITGKSVNKKYLAMNKYLYFVNLSYFLMYKENLLKGEFRALSHGSGFDPFIEEKSLICLGWEPKLSNIIKNVIDKTMNYFKVFSVEELIEINSTDIPWIDVWKNKDFNGTTINLNNYVDAFQKMPMYKRYLKTLNFKVENSILG